MHDCNYTGVAMNIEKKKKKVMGDVKIWCNFLGVAIDILFLKKNDDGLWHNWTIKSLLVFSTVYSSVEFL